MYFTAQQRHVLEHPYEAEARAGRVEENRNWRWRNFVAAMHNKNFRELGVIWAAKTEEELTGEKI